ncbi:ornithine decarboxylase 1-like [Metopolophium dirhodum]|uniref:ornithine decarboxylase 1-like n=1 Tax=Metopolophium dirhodum TaxID=44670 RepID=UPI0029906FA8|nr:ornithine decarboxylase 1-like [Metopolophium dirhodum]XP_060857006.1 ornithine decarboxylase 1-like [Metopolophium dirhodum]XP_060857007.1 ornithine decarboxylase 1-like [Metopolophium dirhodum]XP_060857008.1 ornithine decarboxylase 1-like [Metopolophium dirhodum]
MKIFRPEEQIHIIDNEATVEETIKDIVGTNVISDPFYIFDVGDLVNKAIIWQKTLPRVKPFYAVKCNDNSLVLEILAAFGTNFDCASKAEIKKVLDLGVNPTRVIFANPAKMASHIKYAMSKGVYLTTFDNKLELYKMKSLHPSCNLVIRIRCDATEAQCPLGIKYGCDPLTEAPSLLALARDLGLSVVGVSFHVGSGCNEPAAFQRAIAASAGIFQLAQELGFMNMHLLNIGGGFPGDKNTSLDKIANIVNDALNEWFPPNNGVTIIAEPGRYFVASAFTLATKIHSIKKRSNDESHIMYFINDGVYGSFNSILYDHSVVVPKSLYDYSRSRPICESSIWGPTCDGLDKVVDFVNMPLLKMDEWITFENMGAYTIPVASTFNGFPLPKVFAVANQRIWNKLKNVVPISVCCFATVPIVATIKMIQSEPIEDYACKENIFNYIQ